MSSCIEPGNALLTDQQEYLDAGVDQYVPCSDIYTPQCSPLSSVLTKPVLEKSLKGMLAIADERRKRGSFIHESSTSDS